MRFLENGENVVFLGPPGVGKTHLASALGLVAAQHRFSAYYINCHQLIEQLWGSLPSSLVFPHIRKSLSAFHIDAAETWEKAAFPAYFYSLCEDRSNTVVRQWD